MTADALIEEKATERPLDQSKISASILRRTFDLQRCEFHVPCVCGHVFKEHGDPTQDPDWYICHKCTCAQYHPKNDLTEEELKEERKRVDSARAIQKAMCAEDVVHFFNTYLVTYDPRLVTQGLPAYIPFDLFRRQEEMLRWLDARVVAAEEGLLEKSRDIGWTWTAAGYALQKWLFIPGFRTTFGSRKVDLVDKLGDPDSILEKVRLMIDTLPPWMRPKGWRRELHALHCKITNPENGNLIGGEGGQEMGRGGRASMYVIDEGAYIDHADSVAAAILANAECRIWASSVNGPGDLFAKKRHDGTLRLDQIFTFHFTDDPRKDKEWEKRKRRELASTPWMFAQEYDIDYTAAVEGICIPAKWVQAALRLGSLLNLERTGIGVAGLDIGDGCARSVLQPRFGPLLTPPHAWLLPDTTNTAFEAIDACKEEGLTVLNYDTPGVGKGVASTLKLNPRDGLVINPINTGSPATWQTLWDDGQNSRQKCANLKAELWWLARERFRCAAEHYVFLTGDEILGIEPKEHDVDELFVFEPAEGHVYRQLIVELSTPTRQFNTAGKIMIESKQDLAKRGVASPDYADACVLTLVPDGSAEAKVAANPIIATRQRGYEELQGGAVSGYRFDETDRRPVAGGYKPAVPTATGRFNNDFARDW
jgi:phage terminase large subunit